jgi:thiol-disulfide isomerase/thioredoxin
VVNNHFEFNIHSDTVIQSQYGRIGFTDTDNKRNGLAIINPYSPHKNKPDLYGDFYIEPGKITFSGDLSANRYAGISMTAGEQNDFHFKNVDLAVTMIRKDSVARKKQINRYKKLIADNPHAYPAMFALYNWRFSLTNVELKALYDEFDDELQQSYLGKKVSEFLKKRPGEHDLKPNALLTDQDDKSSEMIDTTKKLNMIVFWASWCGPCRQEIPALKEVFNEFKDNRNFRMVSVSIDKNKEQWKQMLELQKMPWQQLVGNAADLEKIKIQYNLGYIPQVYFVNSKRELISRVGGFDPANEQVFKKIITNYAK